MKRTLYLEERTSRLAVWSLRIVLFSLPVVILSAVLYRFNYLGFQPAAVALCVGLALAVVGGLVAVAACFSIWESGWRGLGKAVGALFITLAMLAGPAAVLARGMMLPPLTDISTDTVDAPHFRAMGFARPSEAHSLLPPDPAQADLQRVAYPAIKPMDLDATPEEVFNALLGLVRKRKWRILDAVPPRGGVRDGQIEAVAPTPILGFRNDIVIRVRATQKGARVDVRSASRYGAHDLGENAWRISSLMADLQAERRKKK